MKEILTNSDVLELISKKKISVSEGAQLISRIKSGEKIILSSLSRSSETSNSLSMYTERWAEIDLLKNTKRNIAGENILCFCLGSGIDYQKEEILKEFSSYKNACIVTSNEEFERDGKIFTVDYTKENQIMLLCNALEEYNWVPDTIVFMLNPASKQSIMPIEKTINKIYSPILRIIKMIFTKKWNNFTTLYFAYQQTQGVQPEYTAFNGLGRTIVLENQRFDCHCVGYEVFSQLKEEMMYITSRENNVLYKDGNRFVSTMATEYKTIEDTNLKVRDKGVYIITGGNGAVARKFAKLLARKYHASLVLVGRSEKTNKVDEYLNELQMLGGKAIYLSADCSTKEGSNRIVNESKKQFGCVNGIIHCAGVIQDGYIYNKNIEAAYKVFAPKIFGCLYMDEASKACNLDFFMTFSSTAGAYGNAGQADYSYANNFMDYFIQRRNTRVQEGREYGKSISISWPLWKSTGMNVDEETLKNMVKRSGIVPIDIDDAEVVFEHSLKTKATQVIAITGNAKQIQEEIEKVFYTDEMQNKPYLKKELNQDNKEESLPQINRASKEDLMNVLKQMTSKILSIDINAVDEYDDMSEMGFDSISQTTMVNQINDQFGTRYLPTLFYELVEPTLVGLSEYLLKDDADKIFQSLGAMADRSDEQKNEPTIDYSVKDKEVITENKSTLLSQLIEKIKEIISIVLGIAISDIDENDDMKDLGMDSIFQTKVVNEINEEFQENYLPTIFFELLEPTIHGLCEYLLNADLKTYSNYFKEESYEQVDNKCETKQQTVKKDVIEEHQDSICHVEDEDLYAIIGMSCKMPQAHDVNEFWDNIKENKNAISSIPLERVRLKAFTREEAEKYRGAFISDVDQFDAAFFGISPREAEYMDPQQRLVLTCAWNAIEDAAYTPTELSELRTGVFIGTAALNYLEIYKNIGIKNDEVDPYIVTGMDSAILSGRVSYQFNLNGPCETINTACSSSLSSVVAAIDSLKLGRCEVAIVGGVNLILSSTAYKALDIAGMLSASGKCSTFDEKADGYVRGEGCGVIILKRYKDAVKDHDNIHAVLCGAAVNHGGRANSLTAPNMLQQAKLIEEAITSAKISPQQIGYIETHGTGTKLGDPVEINGLKKAFRDLNYGESTEKTCALGSVKTNIGHLEAAAGMAGLIKTILVLKNKKIPGLSFFEKLNSNIEIENTPFYINKKTEEWIQPIKDGEKQPRYACISSFGFGGANAHLVLKEYKAQEVHTNQDIQLIPLSAKSEIALMNYARQLKAYIEANKESINIESIAYSLQCGREQMKARTLFIVENTEELIQALDTFISEDKSMTISYKKQSKMNDKMVQVADDWMQGKKSNWDMLWTNDKPLKVSLPTYCFENKRFWINSYETDKTLSTISEVQEATQPKQACTLKLKTKALQQKESDSFMTKKSLVLRKKTNNENTTASLVDNDQSKNDLKEQPKPILNNEGLRETIVKILVEILHLSEEELDDNLPFKEYGLDSIGGAEFINKLNHTFHTHIKSIEIYDHSTVEKITLYLKEVMEAEGITLDAGTKVCEEEAAKNEVKENQKVAVHKETKQLVLKNQSKPNMNVMSEVERIVSEVLHLDTSEIEPDCCLKELGLDSIGSMEIAKALNDFFKCSIKAFMLYDINTVEKITEYLKEHIIIEEKAEPIQEEVNQKEEFQEESTYKDTDIAVIGMSLRAPKADNLDEFWNVIENNLDCVTEVPPERWSLEGFYDPDPSKPNRSYCKWGGFLHDIDKFDPLFFKMTPSEAEVIEPQQRLFLEESYKAIEMAGYSAERISGKRCGVYVGVGISNDYKCLKDGTEDNDVAAHAMLGSANCILASRISYFLNLKGPALAIDCACSSSHVAIHMACEALRNNEIEMAISGGVTVEVTKSRHIYTSKSGALSHKGNCSTFDESADGYVPSEGVGAVILKRLDKAIKDGDHIYGVIKASCTNQDGTTNGITAPSAESQYHLEVDTYDKYEINPRDISYVEAHGTGTKLGDPIEVSALTKAFEKYTSDKHFCAVGAIKANVGHNSAAAGVSSLIKVLLCMQHAKLPALLHYKNCNEQIDFEDSPFYVPTQLTNWKCEVGKKRLAAISGFGLSGTNCHIVVEEWKKPGNQSKDKVQDELVVVSALNKKSLHDEVSNLYEYILNHQTVKLADLSYTLGVGRTAFKYRMTYVVSSIQELLQRLKATLSDTSEEISMLKPCNTRKHLDQIKKIELEQELKHFSNYNLSERKKKLEEVASYFCEGYQIDFKNLHDKNAEIIPLPTYPFDKISCWFEELKSPVPVEKKDQPDTSESIAMNLKEVLKDNAAGHYIYELTVYGNEFYLTDHVINKNKVFPAVAYLELVYAAGKRVLGREIKEMHNIVLAKPIIVDKTNFVIRIELTLKKSNLEFEIITISNQQKNCHAQGSVNLEFEGTQVKENINIQAVEKRYTEIIPSESIYKYYGDVGVDYGKCFRTIQKMYHNDSEVLSCIKLNEKCRNNLSQFFFHPSLVDAMLQTAIGVMTEEMLLHSDKYFNQTFLPFVFGKVRVYADPRNAAYGYVEYSSNNTNISKVCKLNIYMLDENGKILVEIIDFYGRAVSPTQEEKVKHNAPKQLTKFPINSKIKYYTHHQVKEHLLITRTKEPVLLIDDCNELYEYLLRTPSYKNRIEKTTIKALANGELEMAYPVETIIYYVDANEVKGLDETLYSLFKLIQCLLAKKSKYEILFTYKKSQDAFKNAYCQAIRAFAKTVNQESSKVYIKCIELETLKQNNDLLDLLICEGRSRKEEQVYYVNNERSVYSIRQVETTEKSISRFVNKGVYLIAGGVGKIGIAFAKYLAKYYGASVVVTGRSALTKERIDMQDELKALGYDIRFIQSDVTSIEDCKQLHQTMKQYYGTINGVILAAGIIKDASIFHKKFEDLKQVVDVKVNGFVNLYEAFQEEHLDIFASFSAIAAMFGNVGQSDYSYANCFLDCITQALAEKSQHKKLLAMDWPLWKDGGMKLDERLSEILEKSEMTPLETQDGLNAFEMALSSSENCMLAITLKHDDFNLKSTMMKESDEKEQVIYQDEETAGNEYEALEARLKQIIASKLKIDLSQLDIETDLNDYGIDSITITSLSYMINDALDIELTPTVFFELDSMSIKNLAQFIYDKGLIKHPIAIEKNLGSVRQNYNIVNLSDNNSYIVEDSQESDIQELRSRISEIIATKLKINKNQLDTSMDLNEYGIDSITITSLTHYINEELNLEMTPTVFFELETMSVDGLVEFIIDNGLITFRENTKVQEVNQPKATIELQEKDDDIAIIGLAAKLPDCNSLEEFWNKLVNEESMIKPIPNQRFDWQQCAVNESEGIKKAALMNDVDQFAADFFHISRREAEIMDPQQRIMLEMVWHLFENAGYSPTSFENSQTGVFLGISNSDYSYIVSENNAGHDQMCATGLSSAITANRLSFYYNLNGPSEVINTACSSSLVSVHRGCKAILEDECQTAIAGGISTILSPVTQEMYGRLGVLSEKGICAPFDQGADGIMRGEGAGLVLLKKLSDAKRDKDHIYAVIKGSSVNHGGRVSSLTVPSRQAQSDLITHAIIRAKVDPKTIQYIECHGTGTKLGDPIEVDGIKQAFEKLVKTSDRSEEKSCGLGSVKSNMGHLEAASGIASLLKVILSMNNGILPASINFNKINPYIKLERSPFYIVEHSKEWPHLVNEKGEITPRRAGISSFGLGGTNSHVILEEYVEQTTKEAEKRKHLIILSMKEKNNLKCYVKALLEYLEEAKYDDENEFLQELEWTLQTGRTAFEHRLAIICSDLETLVQCLKDYLKGVSNNSVYEGTVESKVSQRAVGMDSNMEDLAKYWICGGLLEWNELYKEIPFKIPTVTYPFERKRYWVGKEQSKEDIKEVVHVQRQENINDSEKTLERKCKYLKVNWREIDKSIEEVDNKNVAIIYNTAASHVANSLFDYLYACDCTLMKLGNNTKCFPDGSWEIDESKASMLEQYFTQEESVPDVIYYMVGSNQPIQECVEANALTEGEKAAQGLLQVIKELKEKATQQKVITLKVITDKAFEVNESQSVNPDLAALYGLVKCAASEYQNLRFEYYDANFEEINLDLLNAFNTDVVQTPIVIRDDKAYSRSLIDIKKLDVYEKSFKENGVYVILGGYKGIGYEIGQYLVKRYHAKVVLTGRSKQNDEINSKIEYLGANAQYISADLNDINQMRQLVSKVKEAYGTINGIINSTGVLEDKLIENLTVDYLKKVLLPKVTGNKNLALLLNELELDFIVIFSSIASFTGSIGRSAYTAASNAADQISNQMAHHTASTKVRVINWSFWDQVGMQLSQRKRELLLKQGIKGIEIQEGLQALEDVLAQDEIQVAVGEEVEKDVDITYEVETKEEAVKDIKAYIIECLSTTLKIQPDELDELRAFNDYGLDSLLEVEMIGKINNALHINLRTTDLINYPNIRTIVEHIEEISGKKEIQKVESDEDLLEVLNQLSSGESDINKIIDLL